MKFLVVGLGNIGSEYEKTRHNIGFRVLDAFAKASNLVFTEDRYGAVAQFRIKNQSVVFLKPNTFMNLSGNAVRYWMQKESIDLDHLLVVVDDLALPFGFLRMKGNGSDGGHNGLKNIQQMIGTEKYARLRFGIGSGFQRGQQIDYVLGDFSAEEQETLQNRLDMAGQMISSFCLSGIQTTMNQFNNK